MNFLGDREANRSGPDKNLNCLILVENLSQEHTSVTINLLWSGVIYYWELDLYGKIGVVLAGVYDRRLMTVTGDVLNGSLRMENERKNFSVG